MAYLNSNYRKFPQKKLVAAPTPSEQPLSGPKFKLRDHHIRRPDSEVHRASVLPKSLHPTAPTYLITAYPVTTAWRVLIAGGGTAPKMECTCG